MDLGAAHCIGSTSAAGRSDREMPMNVPDNRHSLFIIQAACSDHKTLASQRPWHYCGTVEGALCTNLSHSDPS
jgi:hypothetical protein